ncbi:hypothetical protein AB0A76_31520 [Streptomyces exfoliatus]|uniref:Uncharacterized protein n=1 Tax=Streptomyces exfoliatus TaxID=1905 RepID=A0ABV3D5C8_STREX
MMELAASLGCVYEHCVDTDSYPDGTPYCAWWVRLPAAEHARLDKDGLPQAIGPVRRYMTTQLPDGLKWEVTPDREYTVDHVGSVALRAAYDDLIAPFERALLPLRRMGPTFSFCGRRSGSGRRTCWSARSTCGCATTGPPAYLAGGHRRPVDRAAALRRRARRPPGPLRLHPAPPFAVPAPPGPAIFTARITSGSFPGKSSSRTKAPDALGTAHQGTANDPDVLAERVAHDLKLLWPHLTGPEGR